MKRFGPLALFAFIILPVSSFASQSDFPICVGEGVIASIGGTGFYAEITGILDAKFVMARFCDSGCTSAKVKVEKVARLFGCAGDTAFCVGKWVVARSGQSATIMAVLSSDEVMLQYQDGPAKYIYGRGYAREKIKYLASTEGCVSCTQNT